MRSPVPLAEWIKVKRLRQAVRDARTCPERVCALCDYQGALHQFVDRYHHLIDHALQQLAANKP